MVYVNQNADLKNLTGSTGLTGQKKKVISNPRITYL